MPQKMAQRTRQPRTDGREVSKMGKIIFVNDHKFYYELDGIRLIYEDNQLTGWYDPELSEVI